MIALVMGIRQARGLALLLPALAACPKNGFVVVTVTEAADGGKGFPDVFQLRSTASDNPAGGAPSVGLGPLSASPISFPQTFVVQVPPAATSLSEIVEALDRSGNTVLRGSNSTTFSAGSPDIALAVSLSAACSSGQDCDPVQFCQGLVSCTAQGACVSTTNTSPPGFGAPCGNDGGRCDEQLACVAPFGTCGDGVRGSDPLPDGGVFVEQCDWGNGEDGGECTGPNGDCNSDTEPNACRTNCVLPYCGDGVVDTGERCDLGAENGTEQGCNATCTLFGKATRIAGNGDLNALPDGGTSLCPYNCYADGPGNQAQFDGVAGLAVVGRTLYVADTSNQVIRAVDLASPAYTVSTLAGDAGVPGTDVQACSTTQDGTGYGACFFLPVKPLAYQPPGQAPTLLVGTGMDVRQITLGPDGGVVTTLAGPNSGNNASENSSFPVPFTGAKFNDVTGIAVDPATGIIYTVDEASGFIHRLDPATQVDYCLVGGTSPTSTTPSTAPTCPSHNAFSDPKSAVILDGGLFLTDSLNNYVRHLTLPGADAGEDAGTVVTNVAGNGGAGFADSNADGGAVFSQPSGICSDGSTLYVVDSKNQAVRQIDPVTYQVTTVIGGPDAGLFDNPYDCAWDPDAGVLYVSDETASVASPDGIGNVIYMIQ